MPIRAIRKDPKDDYEKFLKVLNTITDLPGVVMSPVMRPVIEKLPPALRTLLFGVDDPMTVMLSAGGLLGGPLKIGIIRNSGAPILTSIKAVKTTSGGQRLARQLERVGRDANMVVKSRAFSELGPKNQGRTLRALDALALRELHKAGLRTIPREKAIQAYKNLAAKTPRTGRSDDFGKYALEGIYVPSYFGTGPNVSARNFLEALRNTLYGSSFKTVQKLPNVIAELLEGK